MVSKVQRSIKDSKLRKQFNLRAKDRTDRKKLKEKGLLTKYVDKRERKQQKKDGKKAIKEGAAEGDAASGDDISMLSEDEQVQEKEMKVVS